MLASFADCFWNGDGSGTVRSQSSGFTSHNCHNYHIVSIKVTKPISSHRFAFKVGFPTLPPSYKSFQMGSRLHGHWRIARPTVSINGFYFDTKSMSLWKRFLSFCLSRKMTFDQKRFMATFLSCEGSSLISLSLPLCLLLLAWAVCTPENSVLFVTAQSCSVILFHTIGFGKSLNSAVQNEHVCRSWCMHL